MKGVQCYELFGGIALENHTFSFFFFETEIGQILPHLCNSLMISMKFYWHKKSLCGAKVFYREHALVYPNHNFMTCGGVKTFTSTTIFDRCGGKRLAHLAG